LLLAKAKKRRLKMGGAFLRMEAAPALLTDGRAAALG